MISFAGLFIASGTLFLILSQQPCLIDVCSGSAKTVTLSSITLYSGLTASPSNPAGASLLFSVNNPGADTHVSSIALWIDTTSKTRNANTSTEKTATVTSASSTENEITSWQNGRNSADMIGFTTDSPINDIPSGQVTSFSYYPRTQSPINITSGAEYSFMISFANGQSLSGFVIAQS